MKRTIKITAVSIVALLALILFGKHEAFLERHYDTLDTRIVERTSILGITISKKSTMRRNGYSKEYRLIYGVDPPDDRWHSVSIRPIRKRTILIGHHISVMTPRAILLRNLIAEKIFKRYLIDHSKQLARDSFDELEALLPSTKNLEKLTSQEAKEAYNISKNLETLKDLAPLF